MRYARLFSLVCLALSLALLGLQDFRWALQIPAWEHRYNKFTEPFMARLSLKEAPEPEELAVLTAARMQMLIQEANAGDARAAAFLALYLPKGSRDAKFEWAEKAAGSDRSLAWVYSMALLQYPEAARDPVLGPRIADWIGRLEQADPDNAVPHLIRAEFLRQRMSGLSTFINPRIEAQQDLLAHQTEWLTAMDAAFRAPRYNNYWKEQFFLSRGVLAEHGWLSPWFLLVTDTYPIGNLRTLREYANLQVYLGQKEARAGQTENAIRRYYVVENYAQRMGQSGDRILDTLIAASLEKIVGQPLADALDKVRPEEAAGVRIRLEDDIAKRLRDPLIQTTNQDWDTGLVRALISGIVVFSALALIAFLYLGAKLVIRADEHGHLYDFTASLLNCSAVLLLICCLSLYVTYRPYADNFRSYMSATQDLYNFSYLTRNSLPIPMVLKAEPAHDHVFDYSIWASAAFILAIVLAAFDPRRDKPTAGGTTVRGAAAARNG
jgi:hypothetical protein